MHGVEIAVDGPRNRLTDRPASRALAVEPELARQPIESFDDRTPVVTELGGANDGGNGELALADERFRVDHEPRLPLRGQNVVRMEVLVHEDLLSLRRGQLLEDRDRRVDECLLERLPCSLPLDADRAHPPCCLVSQRRERRSRRLPQPRQEIDEDLERPLSQVGAGPAALEQQNMALVVASQQAHRSVALPVLERVRLVLALAMRPLNLEDDVPGGDDVRDEAAGVGRLKREVPLRRALLDQLGEAFLPSLVYARVGQRYASGRRWERDGSRRRTSSSHARSSSAEITVSSSGACASTVPHGSTISERP